MRRGLASLLMGLSLILASAGWAGFVLNRTVLDESYSTELINQSMAYEPTRAVLIDRLGIGMESILPESEPMSRQELAVAAATALNDPKAKRALQLGLAEAHRTGLSGQLPADNFSDFDINEAARLSLIASRPTLRGQILVNPLVEVELPVRGLTWLSGLSSLVNRFAVLAVAGALIGFAISFVVARDPSMVMRRAAWWILGSAAFWTLSGFATTAIVRFLVPSSYLILAVTVEVFFDAMRDPATIMASFGIGMLVVSQVVPALNQRRGALLLANAAAGGDIAERHQAADAKADATESTLGTKVWSAEDWQAQWSRESRSGVADRLSAAWLEGHGYLDDSRVAPFIGSPSERV